jgi:hypothetical protein
MNRHEDEGTKVLLQNMVTSLYFCQGQEAWTPRYRQAYNFGIIQAALETAQQENLSDVQVVLVINREGSLEFLPLQIQALIQAAPREARRGERWGSG